MKKTFITSIALLLAGSAIAQNAPRNVIMYIGDGFGISAKTAARMALGQGTDGKRITSDPDFHVLSLDKLKYVGTATTHSRNSWITDSGPGASVYACGPNGKIDNEAISFNCATGTPVETILEKARKNGYAVGIITTTRVTHATPAAFGSHIWFRDLEDYIAAQFISSTSAQYAQIYNDPNSLLGAYNPARDWELPQPKVGAEVDVILGGGARHFLPRNYYDTVKNGNGQPIYNSNNQIVRMKGSRIDSVNLVGYAKNRGYEYVNSREALLNMDTTGFYPGSSKKLLGLFNASHMNYEQDRQMNAEWEPSLFEMTEVAIRILKAKGGSKGFFLIVEGGRIDHLEHANSGGITVVPGTPDNQYIVDADQPSYVGGGEAIYGVTPTTPRHADVFGSDYLIKEVLAFDYAVAKGKELLNDNTSETLIFSSSDHECGGTAIVGLHDEADAQNNGTLVRTYALGPHQLGVGASSGGGPSLTTFATPSSLGRGDIDYGANNPNGWYPQYTTYNFQNRPELWPQSPVTGRRIVVAYASNPLTNGNGTRAGGTPGNHTPMDVWVGADDNVGGTFASQITGIGLFDNTFLTHIMEDFYDFSSTGFKNVNNEQTQDLLTVYPNPANTEVTAELEIKENGSAQVTVTDLTGKLVATLFNGEVTTGVKSFNWSTVAVPSGIYMINVTAGGVTSGKKVVVSH